MDIDWTEECLKGVQREAATQHHRCASCLQYMPSWWGQVGKCGYWCTKEANA